VYVGEVGEADDELERAARRRRERLAAEENAKPSPDEAAARRERRRREVRRDRVDEALAEAGGAAKVGGAIAVTVGMLGPIAIALFVWDLEAVVPLIVMSLASMVGAFTALWINGRLFATIRRRRVLAVAYGFDATGYLEALGENRRNAVLVARAKFTRPWPDDKRASARDAVLEWMPTLALVEWQNGALVLHSAELDCTEWLEDSRCFNNKAIHACFDEIARRVIPRLHAVSPITQLEVDLLGEIEAFDAEP
jgi:hypothetical protein